MKTDVILLKARVPRGWVEALKKPMLEALVNASISGIRIAISADVESSDDTVLTYLYINPQKSLKVSKEQHEKLSKKWHGITRDNQAVANRLIRALECPGFSSGKSPGAHYVVETNTDKGWFNEIAAWYDMEHMLGLASVPGTIHAVRFINLDKGPRSVACYDLENPSVLESAPWLAVRRTAWSSHCRPHFRDTIRTMFSVSKSFAI